MQVYFIAVNLHCIEKNYFISSLLLYFFELFSSIFLYFFISSKKYMKNYI